MRVRASRRVALVTGAARGIGAATVTGSVRAGLPRRRRRLLRGRRRSGYGTEYELATADELEALAGRPPRQVVPLVADVRDRRRARRGRGLGGGPVRPARRRRGRRGGHRRRPAPVGDPGGGAHSSRGKSMSWACGTPPPSPCRCMLAGPEPGGCRFVAVASAAGAHGLFGSRPTRRQARRRRPRPRARRRPGRHRRDRRRGLAGLDPYPHARAPPPASTASTPWTHFASSQLLRRLIDPDEIAATIAFCCSREGAVLNGSVVSADEGFTP